MPTVLFFGASRGVGYHAYRNLTLQRPDLRCLLFLRSFETFRWSREGLSLSSAEERRTQIIEGDVLNLQDVRNALTRAGNNLHAIVFSIGTIFFLLKNVFPYLCNFTFPFFVVVQALPPRVGFGTALTIHWVVLKSIPSTHVQEVSFES